LSQTHSRLKHPAHRRADGRDHRRSGISARIAAFQQGLQQLGWSHGRNLSIDTRWATTNPDNIRKHAAELAALTPDVVVAGTGTATVAPLLQVTRSVPIVFAFVLKGEKPAEMPVQAPTKYETVINRKTIKSLGLTVPAAVLARADAVVE